MTKIVSPHSFAPQIFPIKINPRGFYLEILGGQVDVQNISGPAIHGVFYIVKPGLNQGGVPGIWGVCHMVSLITSWINFSARY